MLSVDVLRRSARVGRKGDLDDAEAVAGVGTVLEHPDFQWADRDQLAVSEVDNFDGHGGRLFQDRVTELDGVDRDALRGRLGFTFASKKSV